MAFSLPAPITLEVNRKFDWKVLALLIAAGLVGFVAVLPYTLTLEAEAIRKATLAIPLPLLLVLQGIQALIIVAVIGGLGYFLATRIGLGLPFIEGALNGKPIWDRLPRIAWIAIPAGVIVGVVVIVLDLWIFGPAIRGLVAASGGSIPATINPPAWQGFLASFYGGIVEETELRLGVLTLLAWLGRFVGRTADNRPSLAVLWIANVVAAILFGLGHLPATAAAGLPLVPIVIVRAVVLNGTIGLLAGWLYWRWGLESAMIAHFSGDIVLHVLAILAGGGLA